MSNTRIVPVTKSARGAVVSTQMEVLANSKGLLVKAGPSRTHVIDKKTGKHVAWFTTAAPVEAFEQGVAGRKRVVLAGGHGWFAVDKVEAIEALLNA